MLKGALQWLVYHQRTGSISRRPWQPLQISPCMLVLILPTPGGWRSWVNFSGKEGHPNVKPSTRPGIELGTSGLGGRNLNHCANPSGSYCAISVKILKFWAKILTKTFCTVISHFFHCVLDEIKKFWAISMPISSVWTALSRQWYFSAPPSVSSVKLDRIWQIWYWLQQFIYQSIFSEE